jgi:hypothetical protein
LEAARLELGRLESKLIETEAARRVFGELVVYFRQRLMYLPGALKNKLRLDLGQTLALQKEIRDRADRAQGPRQTRDGWRSGNREASAATTTAIKTLGQRMSEIRLRACMRIGQLTRFFEDEHVLHKSRSKRRKLTK